MATKDIAQNQALYDGELHFLRITVMLCPTRGFRTAQMVRDPARPCVSCDSCNQRSVRPVRNGKGGSPYGGRHVFSEHTQQLRAHTDW
jgi:hypothetical protein